MTTKTNTNKYQGTSKRENVEEMTEKVVEMLSYNPFRTTAGLKRYLLIIGDRLEHISDEERKKVSYSNRIGSLIVNTALRTKYGDDLFISYRINERRYNGSKYEPWEIITSRRVLEENGFETDLKLEKLEPITFFNSVDGDVFDAVSLSDIEISHEALDHAFDEEHLKRLPESWSNKSKESLAIQLRNGIKESLLIHTRSKGYIKPSYTASLHKISWLCPVCLDGGLVPSVVAVITKVRGEWVFKSILPYDDCINDRIRAIDLYAATW